MNTTTAYRPRRISSPYQPVKQMPKKIFNVQQENHKVNPIRAAVEACIGSHALVAVVEEDIQTLDAMSHVEGLVAFIATLKRGNLILSQGRGSSVLGPNNRFVSRAVHYAYNSAIADAAYRATRGLDTFRGPSKAEVEEAYQARDEAEAVPASEKQKSYLFRLIQSNVADEDERERQIAQIDELSKREAGLAIESYTR